MLYLTAVGTSVQLVHMNTEIAGQSEPKNANWEPTKKLLKCLTMMLYIITSYPCVSVHINF